MLYPEPESSTLEWKRELPKIEKIINTLIGFCNQQGGKLVIGVSDKGEAIGLEEAEIERILEWIDHAIFQATSPPIKPSVYTRLVGEKRVLILEVGKGMQKPYFRKAEGLLNGTYIRLGRSTLKATPEIIEELQWQSRGIDFEAFPCYLAQIEDLAMESFQRFLHERRNHGTNRASEKLLEAYRLATREQSILYPTYAGLLLFCDRPQHFLSEAMIICTHFKGRKGREALATVDCEGPLLDQLGQALEFICSRLYRSFTVQHVKRKEELEIPEIAIREALMNALIHRNYHIKSPTKVAIYEDRVEIFNPGQFPGPIDPNDWNAGITYLRNPVLARIFREWGYIEKMGTGLIAIHTSYSERNLPPPRLIEGTNFVKCILPRPTLEPKAPIGAEASRVMELFDLQESISTSDVMKHLKLSRATAVRKIKELIASGYLMRTGQGRSVRYKRR